MAYEWTPERLAALSKEELKNLQGNARDRGDPQLVERCQSEIAGRTQVKRVPKGNASDLRTLETRRLEANAAELLQATAESLSARFDLTRARANELSQDVKRFRAHSLTDKSGRAKVGGAQRQSRLIFDRYLSYRLRDDVCTLSVIMFPNDVGTPHYQVIGSKRLIDDHQPITEIRPFLEENEVSSLTPVGRTFSDFREAELFFAKCIEKLAIENPFLVKDAHN